MAEANFTAPTHEQLLNAMGSIALLADSMQKTFEHTDDIGEALTFLMAKAICQIGYIADQCQSPVFRLKDPNDWVMPVGLRKEDA